MAKAQQMRWSKPTVQPFLDVRTGRAERHARARLPPSPSRLPARQQRPQADSSGGVITSHDLAWSPT